MLPAIFRFIIRHVSEVMNMRCVSSVQSLTGGMDDSLRLNRGSSDWSLREILTGVHFTLIYMPVKLSKRQDVIKIKKQKTDKCGECVGSPIPRNGINDSI